MTLTIEQARRVFVFGIGTLLVRVAASFHRAAAKGLVARRPCHTGRAVALRDGRSGENEPACRCGRSQLIRPTSMAILAGLVPGDLICQPVVA